MARNKKGRQKIKIVKMEKNSNLQVTFSKRRHGLFKKASELCTLCGVEIGVIVFSPGRKVFAFGNPDVRSVIDRFKNHNHNPFRLVENCSNATIQGLNSLFTQELAMLEVMKEKKKSLEQLRIKREEMEKWWEKPVNQLDFGQTTHLINVLENMKMELEGQRSQHLQEIVPQNNYGGSYNNIVHGGNIDIFDQRNMIDVNVFNYNRNMIMPNHGPMFGFNNNNNVMEVFDPRYNRAWPEYNPGQY